MWACGSTVIAAKGACASCLARQHRDAVLGGDQEQIQLLLGHFSLKTTERYLKHVVNDSILGGKSV